MAFMLRLGDEAEQWVFDHALEPEFDAVMKWISGTLCEAEHPEAYVQQVTVPDAPPVAIVPDTLPRIGIVFTVDTDRMIVDVDYIEEVT